MPGEAEWLRAEMGRELARQRRAARLSQQELALLTRHYSRSTVSLAELGKGRTGRAFWAAVDSALGTGGFFADACDLLRDPGPERSALAGAGADLGSDPAMKSRVAAEARQACARCGWPVSGQPGRLRLMTGTTVDALEVDPVAGIMASKAWEETGGAESAARGIPRLPSHHQSLVVIAAGKQWYFLVKPGSYPWPASPGNRPARPHIRWHSAGGTIPAPPCDATWAYLPAAALRLPPAHAVLDLLGWAASRVGGPFALTVHGRVTVTPAN